MASVTGRVAGIICVRCGHWRGPRYDLSFEFTPVDGAEAEATILKSSYLAIPVEQVAGLMRTVGFENVRRVDGRFFQPVLVGTRPA